VACLAGIPRTPLPGGIPWEFVVGGITALGMAFAAALAVAGCHRACLALGARESHATLLSIVLGGGTFLWAYRTSLYSAAWAAAFLIEARRGLSPEGGSHEISSPSSSPVASAFRRKTLFAAALVAIAIVAKPTAIVIAPAFVVAVLLDERAGARSRVRAAVGL